MDRTDLVLAYQMVFNDLCKSRLFEGIYDATNGNEQYMGGIETVMEVIATRGYSEGFAEHFAEVFAYNMERSKSNV